MVRYEATTGPVTVAVRPVYLDGESDPLVPRYTFAYFVRIQNDGPEPVQLLRRRWLIRDAAGHAEEVEGAGVVGQQPVIEPGDAHVYNSFCVLQAMEGTMEGTYLMQRDSGARFRVQIPLFHLRARAN